MMTSGLPAALAALLLLPSASFAATLHSDNRETPLVRRESGVSIGIDKNAEFIEGITEGVDKEEGACNGCEKLDFVVGKSKDNGCRTEADFGGDPGTLVDDIAMCRYAATRAGAFTEPENSPTPFKIVEEQWQLIHPKGCFHVKCVPHGSPAGTAPKDCYFMNLGPLERTNPDASGFAGTPICKRQRYKDSLTPNAQEGCPSHYKVITSETLCGEMCGMDDYKCNPEFRIGINNYTQHRDYPVGCFYIPHNNGTHDLTKVFFNEPGHGNGTSVRGTAMCEVASPMHWITNPPTGLDSGDSSVSATTQAPA